MRILSTVLALALISSVPAAHSDPTDPVVNFAVGKDGQLLWNNVVHSSGLPVVDDAAVHAVADAAPFPPLPANGGTIQEFIGRFSSSTSELSIEIPTEAPEMLSAKATGKPIFDCACLGTLSAHVKMAQYKELHDFVAARAIISFGVGFDGKPVRVKLVKSSGNTKHDELELQAIKDSEDLPVLPGEDITWPMSPRHEEKMAPRDNDRMTGVSTVWGPYNKPNCYSYTKLNNVGVLQLLRGERTQAAASFKQAIQNDPTYEPAMANLRLVQAGR